MHSVTWEHPGYESRPAALTLSVLVWLVAVNGLWPALAPAQLAAQAVAQESGQSAGQRHENTRGPHGKPHNDA